MHSRSFVKYFSHIFLRFLFFFVVWGKDVKFQIEEKCVELHSFTQDQKDVIFYAYYYGKSYGFGYTMAAIAWQESCAGEYLINFADPSAGIYHAHIPGVIKQYTKHKDNGFLRNVVGQMLISNPEFASSIALDHLRYWSRVRRGDFKKIIKSYNKGFQWEKNRRANHLANEYYNSIVDKVKQLEHYIPSNLKNYRLKQPQKNTVYTLPRTGKFHPHAPDAKSPSFYLIPER